jgi:hypothetical protein
MELATESSKPPRKNPRSGAEATTQSETITRNCERLEADLYASDMAKRLVSEEGGEVKANKQAHDDPRVRFEAGRRTGGLRGGQKNP